MPKQYAEILKKFIVNVMQTLNEIIDMYWLLDYICKWIIAN